MALADRRGLYPDERSHASALPVAAIGKEPGGFGIRAPFHAEHARDSSLSQLSFCNGVEVALPATARTWRKGARGCRILLHEGGAHVVADFSMKRGDSGPTQGHVVAAWEWYEDVNGNCEVDPGEPVLAFDKWRIGPIASYIMPTQRVRTPRGNYILVTTYFTLSTRWAESRECFNPVRAASDVDDGVGYHYELIPG